MIVPPLLHPPLLPRVFGWLLCVSLSLWQSFNWSNFIRSNFIPSHNIYFVASFQSSPDTMIRHTHYALIPARLVVVVIVVHRLCHPSPTPIWLSCIINYHHHHHRLPFIDATTLPTVFFPNQVHMTSPMMCGWSGAKRSRRRNPTGPEISFLP